MKSLYPFCLFKPSDTPNFYVAFKNNLTGEYLPSISTRKPDRAEALKTALDWYYNGIPKKRNCLSIAQCSLMDLAKKADLTAQEAEFIAKELQRRGFLRSYVLADSKQDISFQEFLLSFWDYDKSPYIQEKLRKNHGIHRRYCEEQMGIVKRYWVPFFSHAKLLGEISRQDIEDFISHLERGSENSKEAKPKSAKRMNTIIKAGTVALSWAYQKEMIEKDVVKGIVWFSGAVGERQILTPEMAQAVFSIRWKDERWKLASMLAMVTGLRAGEIQGLRVKDLGEECLYIHHSWNSVDGLKTTKTNEDRVVEVPFPSIMMALTELAQSNPHGEGMDGYVFFSTIPNKPIEAMAFLDALRDALVKTGVNKESAKVYTFHGWRHYFTSYMREKVDEKILQQQTGHKTLDMLDHYSFHKIAGDRERLRHAQVDAFNELLPNAPAIALFPENCSA